MILFRLPLPTSTRKSLCTSLTLLLLCLFAASARVAQAQDTSDDDVVRVNTNLVQLNVGVVDHQGHPVTTLSREDFVVYEDGVRQSIQSFEPTSTPFSLVLMLDMSGSTLSFRQTLRQAAWRFIDALSPDDRVAVVAFNEKAHLLTSGFTENRKKIAYAIEVADGRGETQFYKALDFSLKELAKEGKRRKAIVVLTDGIDTQLRNADRASASHAQTNEEAIASVNPEASASLKAVLNTADRLGVTIYPLALPSGDPKRLPLPDPTITAIYTSARTRMQTLANRTGGQLNEIKRLEELGRLYAEVAANLRTLYTIAYQPSGANPHNGNWRAIRIEVARPELIARTRPGYYAR